MTHHNWSMFQLTTLTLKRDICCTRVRSTLLNVFHILNVFTGQVVVSRREAGVRKWTNWLRENLGTRPYAWLRPDFVPPSPSLVVKDPQSQVSRILVEPHLIDAEYRKTWMPFFCRSGLGFVGHLLPQEPVFGLPRITGRDLQEVAKANKSTAGGLDGLAGNEVKALSLPLFSGLAILLERVESTGDWPQGLLDAYIAMIPKLMAIQPRLVRGPWCSPGCLQAVGLSQAWSSAGVG